MHLADVGISSGVMHGVSNDQIYNLGTCNRAFGTMVVFTTLEHGWLLQPCISTWLCLTTYTPMLLSNMPATAVQ